MKEMHMHKLASLRSVILLTCFTVHYSNVATSVRHDFSSQLALLFQDPGIDESFHSGHL